MKPCLTCGQAKGPNDFNPRRPLYCLECEPPEPKKSRAAASLVQIDFEREERKLLTVLHRDIDRLLEASHSSPLSRDQSSTLIIYLKLIAELRAISLLNQTENQLEDQQSEPIQ